MKIVMLGAGSRFTLNVIDTLDHPRFEGCELVLMDVSEARLCKGVEAGEALARKKRLPLKLGRTTSLSRALERADYVIAAPEQDRYANWLSDIEIPRRHGVHQLTGENGGPGGLIHGLRNIHLYQPIIAEMERLCPDAWLLNYTNPMSILCEWFDKHTRIRYAGLCHQVHGSFGVIAEQLGMEPGELQVISAGINHLNWLFDLRRNGKSWMKEFFEAIATSKWWRERTPGVPRQDFSLEIHRLFGMYPIGYDDHIAEYFSCFPEPEEWQQLGLASLAETRIRPTLEKQINGALQAQHLIGHSHGVKPPFPRDAHHPHYRETASRMIVALETGEPTYFDATVGRNNGAVSNLPAEAVLDRPVLIAGGEIRSVHVGALPPGPREVCRRQIALHEMIVQAAAEGDERLVLQALCLDPHVRSTTQARAIWGDFRDHYRDALPENLRSGKKLLC
ncbi:MAG TPA: hypothetical protein VNQ90_14300 [Chthoniobacteraceae bacterium]|nr:hypothetical protein [Chthoniobacteraceae bacterium]